MKSPLVYLMLMRAKNTFKRFFKSPGRIVIALLLIASLAVTLIGGGEAAAERELTRDKRELYALALVFYTVIFALTASNGFQKGASLFKMADVNLLFTAPIRRQTVLFYGLVQQLGTSLIVGFALLFQYATVSQFYDIVYADLLWIVLGYAASVFMGQLFAMTAYSLTAGSEKGKKWLKLGFFGFYALAGLAACAYILPGREHMLSKAVYLANSPVSLCLPVSGWMAAAVRCIVEGRLLGALPGLLGTLAAGAGLVVLVSGSEREYYEDVLAVTEQTHAALSAQKESRGVTVEGPVSRTRVGARGIGKGEGASAIFHKHLLESRRQQLLVLSPTELIFAAVSVVFAWIMREEGGAVPGFVFAVYMQLFSPAMGRLSQELTRPWIYLIPEPAVKKLFWALAESLPRMALTALITYLPISLLCGLEPLAAAAFTLAGFSFAPLFTTGYLASERLFSGLTIKALVMMVYFVAMVILAIPAIALAVILGGVLSLGLTVVMAAMAAANLLVAAVVLLCCRELLSYAELNLR